jgi:hypothetical protein
MIFFQDKVTAAPCTAPKKGGCICILLDASAAYLQPLFHDPRYHANRKNRSDESDVIWGLLSTHSLEAEQDSEIEQMMLNLNWNVGDAFKNASNTPPLLAGDKQGDYQDEQLAYGESRWLPCL